MRALTYSTYGEPEEVLRLDVNAEKPTEPAGPNDVLLRVHATSVNDFDWSLVTGKPAAYRLLFGVRGPSRPMPGIELSGTVEAVGADVTKFKPGDDVYGDVSDHGWGTYAEYVSVDSDALRHKPAGMTHVQAAAIPHASLLAHQGLVEAGNVTPKDSRILINGAGGGMGTYALHIARQLSPSAELTGVDAADKFDSMRKLGYDRLIDYRTEDFTTNGVQYDLILDAKTTRPPTAFGRALSPGGRYVTVGGHLNCILQVAMFGGMLRRLTGKSYTVVALKTNDAGGMDTVEKLFEEGKLSPVIDGPHKLEDIPKLISYFGKGQHKGKVVVSMP